MSDSLERFFFYEHQYFLHNTDQLRLFIHITIKYIVTNTLCLTFATSVVDRCMYIRHDVKQCVGFIQTRRAVRLQCACTVRFRNISFVAVKRGNIVCFALCGETWLRSLCVVITEWVHMIFKTYTSIYPAFRNSRFSQIGCSVAHVV